MLDHVSIPKPDQDHLVTPEQEYLVRNLKTGYPPPNWNALTPGGTAVLTPTPTDTNLN
jgi:hypothetical protein